MFSEQDRSFDFAVSLDLLETDIHDSASNLDDSCLARFKFELILDLHQCSKLRHIVLQNEFPIFELNCGVRSWHTDVADFNLLVIPTAQSVKLIRRFGSQYVYQFTQVLFQCENF